MVADLVHAIYLTTPTGHPGFGAPGPNVLQTGGRVDQGIAGCHGLAKEGASHLIWRDEPSPGPLTSHVILGLEKSSDAHHGSFYQLKISRTRFLALL